MCGTRGFRDLKIDTQPPRQEFSSVSPEISDRLSNPTTLDRCKAKQKPRDFVYIDISREREKESVTRECHPSIRPDQRANN
mmetsp:Transcript_11048/g.23417  ORF Transcript_11048/g.23417 Transcript_11048/m.23417 type:complete len:81 (+) Transcript_11048:167-409(+)